MRVLTATTTVAAAINTPASPVIFAEQEFVGDDGRPFAILPENGDIHGALLQ